MPEVNEPTLEAIRAKEMEILKNKDADAIKAALKELAVTDMRLYEAIIARPIVSNFIQLEINQKNPTDNVHQLNSLGSFIQTQFHKTKDSTYLEEMQHLVKLFAQFDKKHDNKTNSFESFNQIYKANYQSAAVKTASPKDAFINFKKKFDRIVHNVQHGDVKATITNTVKNTFSSKSDAEKQTPTTPLADRAKNLFQQLRNQFEPKKENKEQTATVTNTNSVK